MRSIEDLLPEIELWRGKKVTYAPLNGGLSNVTYKVIADGTPYVLRINGSQNAFLELDRREEALAVKKAHALGIGADMLFGDEEILITEFKPGRMLTRLKIHKPEYIKKVAELLRTAHSITGAARVCSPFELVRKYLNGAAGLGTAFPDGLDAFLLEMEAVERRCAKYAAFTTRYCHNDAYCINILDVDGELCLIDWELSGEGNLFFDLATISCINNFSEAEDSCLLESYFGGVEDEFWLLLRDMKFVNMLREVGWALLHDAMQERSVNHNFDYRESAEHFFNRLKEGHLTQ